MIEKVGDMKPVILREGNYTKAGRDALLAGKVWGVQDIFVSQLTELFEINYPHLIATSDFVPKLQAFIKTRSGDDPAMVGDYIYYPWSGVVLHTISEAEQHRLRTNRMNNLLTREEQQTLAAFSCGVAGLSFGNGIALSLVYSGAADTIKIADSDIFETTNLNRVRVGLPSVGLPKTAVTAREIYEVNPYADVMVFEQGLHEDTIDAFVGGTHPLGAVFDVVDDLGMKVRLRMAAKKAKVPVIMLTSLEDSILVDIERYDLEPEREVFHGLLGGVTDELIESTMTEQDKAQYAMKIVGANHVSYRNLQSLSVIGQDLVSRPHLFGTVSIVCGLATYIVKRIALGEAMPSMRKLVALHEILEVAPNHDDTPEAREQILSQLLHREQHMERV